MANEMIDIELRDFLTVTGVNDGDNVLLVLGSGTGGQISIALFKSAIAADVRPSVKDGTWWIGEINSGVAAEGKTPEFRKGDLGIEYKYITEDGTAWRLLVNYNDIVLKYTDLTEEQKKDLRPKLSDFTDEEIAELQKPAADMIAKLEKTNSDANEAEKKRENEFSVAKEAVESAAADARNAESSALDTANHPTHVGKDNYVYIWNKATATYDKTEVYVRGEGFSVKKVFSSVAEMEAYTGNEFKEGDFALINTGSVEDEDTAKLYSRTADGHWRFLVDMSGAIGFTGKTPQFVIGTVTTSAPGTSASVALEPRPDDADGNPVFAMNIVIPKGDKLVFADLTEDDIKLLQKPANDMISQLEQTDSDIKKAEELRVQAENERDASYIEHKQAEELRDAAENIREKSEGLREQNTKTAIDNANTATKNAKDATDVATELNEHPATPIDGFWHIWDLTTKEYINSGVQAKGDVGPAFKIVGRYGTLDELKTAVPDGSGIDGVFAIGNAIPYNYYAWAVVGGTWGWDDQGQLKGEQGEPFRYEDFTPEQIAALQQPANDMIAKLEQTDSDIKKAEELRVESENERKRSEEERETAEGERKKEEDQRVANEIERKNSNIEYGEAENKRKEGESTRIANEELRKQSETERRSSEEERKKSYIEHSNAEELRNTSEKAREKAEGLREQNTKEAIKKAATATGLAVTVAANPPRIIEKCWAFYDIETESYIVSEFPAIGLTPYVGENGHWWIGTTDTDVPVGFEEAPDDGQDYVRRNKKWEPVSVGDGGNQFTELDDIEIQAGEFENAGAGWNSFTFPHEFPGIPSVCCSPIQGATAKNYFVNLKSVTAKGFLYQLGSFTSSSADTSVSDKISIHYQAIFNGNI